MAKSLKEDKTFNMPVKAYLSDGMTAAEAQFCVTFEAD